MNRLFRAVACAGALGAAALPAPAADVGVSIAISQPGVYGRVDIGRIPQPQVVLAQPVIVAPPPAVYVQPEPVYLWVPVEHRILGIDRRTIAPSLAVLAFMVLMAVVVPSIDDSVDYDDPIVAGDVMDLVGGTLTFVPADTLASRPTVTSTRRASPAAVTVRSVVTAELLTVRLLRSASVASARNGMEAARTASRQTTR